MSEVSYLAWMEGGQDFFAQFGPEVDTDQLMAWLNAWQPVGKS